jgi:hypothetical protein
VLASAAGQAPDAVLAVNQQFRVPAAAEVPCSVAALLTLSLLLLLLLLIKMLIKHPVYKPAAQLTPLWKVCAALRHTAAAAGFLHSLLAAVQV